jgi:hypothetical protein
MARASILIKHSNDFVLSVVIFAQNHSECVICVPKENDTAGEPMRDCTSKEVGRMLERIIARKVFSG